MGTIADKLELLRRTKERQRAYLEQKYPLLDFDTIPFRAYLDLFQGRSYVPGLVAAWKTYGKRNDDADRDDLYDYSGNGRDIKLYNFAFAGMSGYGGYGSSIWKAYGNSAEQVSETVVKAQIDSENKSSGIVGLSLKKGDSIKIKYRISGYKEGCLLRAYTNTRNSEGTVVPAFVRTITADGTYEDTFVWDEDNAANDTSTSTIFIICQYVSATEPIDITIEQLPLYPGALVSDGVDDYGLCIKDFALPDDYTVVAIRMIPKTKNAGLASKGATLGAFLFEAGESSVIAWSYGASTSNSINTPALFSYQSKNSYNGTHIGSGTATDNEDDKLYVFSQGGGSSSGYILYDLRIYDHSLTAEELQTVKDEMMTDYENATGGGIADVTFVADWDAKGRSNDEEADVRSQWTDKATGKVINLSNYAYSQMSGWNGYSYDWLTWRSDINTQYAVLTRNDHMVHVSNVGAQPTWTIINNASIERRPLRLRVNGMREGVKLIVRFDNTELLRATNGEYFIDGGGTEKGLYAFAFTGYNANEDCDVTIEQLPLYPGALVSDGVDDIGSTAEILSEPIGSLLLHYRNFGMEHGDYVFFTGSSLDGGKRLYFYKSSSDNMSIGMPNKVDNDNFVSLARTPLAPDKTLKFEPGNHTAIFRLIFIQEQLDAAQLEFLEWKVSKEYRDWCKANGYEYAINEMLNN